MHQALEKGGLGPMPSNIAGIKKASIICGNQKSVSIVS